MIITGRKLVEIKDALQYAILYAQTEAQTAEFAYLLIEVQTEIAIENNTKLKKDEEQKG